MTVRSIQIFTIRFLLLLVSATQVWIPVALAEDESSDVGVAFYETNIRPLLARHCYQCHSKRAKDLQAELLLDSREGWMQSGQNGPSVMALAPESSSLLRAVRYNDPDLQMPPTAPLAAEDLAKLEHWVRIGAPGPSDDAAISMVEASDPIAGKSHWAFQPLSHDPLASDKSEWSRSSVDRYVVAQLESKGLHPVSDADSVDLARRIFFQLIGLPPTQQEINEFISDEPSQALSRLVDRLLASPEFGKRWGRHWLDLARYSDSNGLDENFLFREAWRYRNWVIDALNTDLPFDRFVMEQLAGDLLPFNSVDQRDQQRIAAGFLVIGPKVLLGNNAINQRMEVADEQLDTIGKALLGQTLGCARCHDHKFDPIPTADYYSMAGIFASTSVMKSRYMLGEQRVMERLIGLGPDGKESDDAYEVYWRTQPKLKEQKKDAESALQAMKENNADAFAALLDKKPNAIAEGAKEIGKPNEARIVAQEELIRGLTAAISNPPKIPPRAMIPEDIAQPADEHIRLAGQFDRLGEQVPRGFLKVLVDDERIAMPVKQSGRIELSKWLVDPKNRAGQLVARVQANRIWHHLMGVGLVRTVDNFGRTGEQPTHPELLDHLASFFIESGWSVKALVREIVLSRTFALSSKYDTANAAIDPDNRSYWRSHRRRLDPESLRDAMLSAANQLDLRPMDSSVYYLGDQATAVGENKVRRRIDFPCRSVYLPVIRNDLPELFRVFDFANPHETTGARTNTIVPTQSLFLLNDEMVMETANLTARRITREIDSKDNRARVDRMFEWILNKNANEEEQKALQAFLIQTETRLISEKVEEPELRALAIVCHALFASSRFQFLE